MPYLKIKKFSFACSFFTFLFLGFLSKLTNPTANADETSLPMCAEEICTNPADAIDGSTICVNDYNDTNLEEAIGECGNVAAGESCNLRQAIHFALHSRLSLTICMVQPEHGQGNYLLNSSLLIQNPEDYYGSATITLTGDTSKPNWRPTIRPSLTGAVGDSLLKIRSSVSHFVVRHINFTGKNNEGTESYSKRCIENHKSLLIESCDFSNCVFGGESTDQSGGAIYSKGPLTIKKSSFRKNKSHYGGAIYHVASDGYPNPHLTIEDSYFTQNKASYNSSQMGGGAIYAEKTTVSIVNTTFYQNSAKNSGGAILYNIWTTPESEASDSLLNLTIKNSTFVGNQADNGSSVFFKFGEHLGGRGTSNVKIKYSIFSGGVNNDNFSESDCGSYHSISGLREAYITSLGGNYWGHLGDCQLMDFHGHEREATECLPSDICADGTSEGITELSYIAGDPENNSLIFFKPTNLPFHTYHFYARDGFGRVDDWASDRIFDWQSAEGLSYLLLESSIEDCPTHDQIGNERPLSESSDSINCMMGSIYRLCGDGKIQLGEACDDGNRENGDQCSRDCLIDFTQYDLDRDGYLNITFDPSLYAEATLPLDYALGDCRDENAQINPEAIEACDGIDNNCDGFTDEGLTTDFYRDEDKDGFGDGSGQTVIISACEKPTNYVANNDDCDDTNGNIHPDASEVCDSIDNNCNGKIDERNDCGNNQKVNNGPNIQNNSPNNDNPETTNNSENTNKNDNGGCSVAPSQSLKTRTLLLLFFCLFPAILFLRSQPIFKTNES